MSFLKLLSDMSLMAKKRPKIWVFFAFLIGLSNLVSAAIDCKDECIQARLNFHKSIQAWDWLDLFGEGTFSSIKNAQTEGQLEAEKRKQIADCLGPINGTFDITFQTFDSAISTVDEENQKLTAFIKGVLVWVDERIIVPAECLTHIKNVTQVKAKSLQFLFDGARFEDIMPIKIETGDFFTEPEALSIKINRGNGSIVIEFLIEREFSGQMDFGWFPFDSHKMIFHFKPEKSIDFIKLSVPTKFNTDGLAKNYFTYFNMEETQMEKFLNDELANISMIKMEFELKRTLTGHLLQTFIPSMMLCIASTGSLFIPSHIVPGRMGLTITSFLSLISLFNGARDDWIECSYLRAVDIWIILCYINVFAALIQYCVVLFLTKGEKMDILQRVGNISEPEKLPDAGWDKKRKFILAFKLENIFRFIMPPYNVIFFTIYMMACLLKQA